MLRALLFDFNGILVGDEPIHFELFRQTLAQKQVSLTEKDYYEKYLGCDDRDCFTAVLKAHGVEPRPELIDELIQTKAALYQQAIESQDLFIPGAIDFVQRHAKDYFLGIVSGALRSEIDAWLKRGNLTSLFQV